MKKLIRFFRINTPFICSFAALLNGVLFLIGEAQGDFVYVASALTGNSVLIDIYIFVMSLRMCVWYKLNIICLLLIHLCELLYNYFDISTSLYLWTVILLALLGIGCFLIFKRRYEIVCRD